MDKNKSQLLAAGRKKLQQFRQKKDGKGGSSHGGKSSKKNDKSQHDEADASVAGTASKNTSVGLDIDVETGLKILVSDVSSKDTSANNTTEVSVAPDISGTMSDPTSAVAPPKFYDGGSQSELSSVAKISNIGEKDVTDSSSQSEGQFISSETFDSEAIRFSSIGVLASEGESMNVNIPVEVGLTSAPVMDVASKEGTVSDGMENTSGEDEESSLSRDYIVVGNLTDAEGAQDPDGFSHDQHNGDDKMEHGGEGRFSMHDIMMTGELETSSRSTQQSVGEDGSQVQLLDDKDDGVVSTTPDESRDPGKEDTTDAENSVTSENLNTKETNVSDKARKLHQNFQQSYFAVDPPAPEGPLETKISSGALEQLEEELLVANFMKDITCMQMKEFLSRQREFDDRHRECVNEISLLNNSLSAVDHKNESLTKDLVQLRSELQSLSTERDAFIDNLRGAEVETKELHKRVHELEVALEVSNQNLSSHSSELDDYRSSLESLRKENERLAGSLASLTDQRNEDEEEKKYIFHENEKLSVELVACQNLIAGLREELLSSSGNLASLSDANRKIEEERESLACENQRLSDAFSDSVSLVEALRIEKVNLDDSIELMMKELESTKEERKHLIHEAEKLSSELRIVKEQFSSEKEERIRLECELKEKMSCLEQLAEETSSLKGKLDSYFAEISELSKKTEKVSCPIEIGTRDEQLHLNIPVQGNAGRSEDDHKLAEMGEDASSNHSAFDIVKGDFKEIEYIVLKLEDAIDSTLPGRSDSTAAPAGISKLIRAFESKRQLGEESEESDTLTEIQTIGDPYISSKKLIRNLHGVIKKLGLHVDNAALLFSKSIQHQETAEITNKELEFRSETMNEHVDSLEACNVELSVLYEVVKQCLVEAKCKNSQLETQYDDINKEGLLIRAENTDLGCKLRDCRAKIEDLQNQFHDLQCVSEGAVSSLQSQLENLQGEVTESAIAMQLEWNVITTQVCETVEKLDKCTSTISTQADEDFHSLGSQVATSVAAAIQVIEDLREKLKSSDEEHKSIFSLYQEASEKFNDLQRRNTIAVDMLTNFYERLSELDSSMSMEPSELQIEARGSHDPLDQNTYDILFDRLRSTLDGSMQLKSEVDDLRCQLSNREQVSQEVEGECIGMGAIQKLLAIVEGAVELEGTDFDLNEHPLPLLESLIKFLVQKCRESDEQVHRFMESIEFKETKLAELQERSIQTSSLNLIHENEILILKESLKEAAETLNTVRSELHEKTVELQQSELRVSSIREKLSIAVAKGKGLVVQRDSLKQSLAATSNELEKCLKELQLKEAKLNQVETKLRIYSEAGERVEALESELSYIRNSAATIRESFLSKDSMLQRIEEILEDLDLSDHFHAQDIIGKVDWLARLAAGSSVPPTDGDQKGSAGGSYSDASFVMDTWRDDMQSNSNLVDDLRRKYDELQGKFFGVAEQNEMLEQSLMERNKLVKRWEELLDKIDVPLNVRPVEPEEKIEWLAAAISEAHHDRISLEKKIENLESLSGSLTSELEDFHKNKSDLEEEVQALVHEREKLSKRLDTIAQNHKELSDNADHFELENGKLQSEISLLQIKLAEKAEAEESILRNEEEIIKLQNMVNDALIDPDTEDFKSGCSSTEVLKLLLKQLIDKYSAISDSKSMSQRERDLTMMGDANFVDSKAREKLDNKDEGGEVLKKELEDALQELADVKVERDDFVGKNESLKCQLEALDRKIEELQSLLSLEEQKCGSVREKLSVAVRKGKSLVQERNGLKQTIEVMTNEVSQLKSELNNKENTLTAYEQKIGELSSYPERVGALESEVTLLRNHLTEMEHYWQDKGHSLGLILSALADIDVGSELNSSDPVAKLSKIEELCDELRIAASTFEQDSKKSRRAAELLGAELDEVQERNDSLQEELEHANSKVARLSQEIAASEAAKNEAISQFETLSYRHFEERRELNSQFMKFESDMELLRNVLGDLSSSFCDVLSQDTEILKNIEIAINSYLQLNEATKYGLKLSLTSIPASGFVRNTKKENFPLLYPGSDSKMLEQLDDTSLIEACSSIRIHLEDLFSEVGGLKEHLENHLLHLNMRADSLSEVLTFVQRELISERASLGVLERDVKHMKSIQEEKDMEIVSLRKNITLLREACVSSLVEIGNTKATLARNNASAVDQGIGISAATHSRRGFSSDEQTPFASSEEMVRSLADKMVLSVKDFIREKVCAIEDSQKELKDTIASLRRELQEKDIQKERICMELVGQIKSAEASASSYSSDLQSTKILVQDLEKQASKAHEERNLLEKRLQEMQDREEASKELQEKLRSLTNMLASKDQEIEDLMQALDVEEVQMDDLRKKIEELEKLVQQKILVVEELEASRGKALKKLSITVNKFDELHQFSASLLAEVEKLQNQLQERDSEVSFLRQEMTRCTNDVLAASQLSSSRSSQELHELLAWFDSKISSVALHESVHENTDQVKECKELLQKKISFVLSELQSLNAAAESKDVLLQVERNRVDDLKSKEQALEKSLREKESQLNMLQGVEESGSVGGQSSELVKVEPLINKWATSSTAPQVRSLRKPNNDQVAIAIDADDPGNNTRLEDEDDDKVHGFKSLASSRIVPKFTRRATDIVDGLWVSCDRALMRQPAFRLGIMIYWAFLHALLASLIV